MAARKQTLSRLASVLRALVVPVAVLGLWHLSVVTGFADTRLVASIGEVVAYFRESVASGDLWIDLFASLRRNFAGFGIGAVVGIASGVLLGLSPFLRGLILPSVNTIKQVSILAWAPLISIWIGLGEDARIFVIAFSAWFPVLFNTLSGVAQTPRELVEVARVYRFSRLQTVWRIVLPAAAPAIFTGLYTALVLSWMVTLGAEFLLTSTRGLGQLLLGGRENLRMDQVLVGIFVIGLIGFALHAVAEAVERRLLAWRGPVASARI